MNTKEGMNFYQQVFEIVNLIPKGRVTSYGAIANALGAKGSARMVGYAMTQSHLLASKIPAHRVVNRNGLLTGKLHFNPPSSMQTKLECEGVIVKNDKIINYKELFWDPMIEIT